MKFDFEGFDENLSCCKNFPSDQAYFNNDEINISTFLEKDETRFLYKMHFLPNITAC
jgi:hypothetical protein